MLSKWKLKPESLIPFCKVCQQIIRNQEEDIKTAKMYDALKNISEGPVGQAIESLGSGAADRMRGGSAQQGKQMVRAQCPSCGGVFPANPSLAEVTCPLCGAKLCKEQPKAKAASTKEIEKPVTKNVSLNVDTINWYDYFKEKGFTGSLSEFLDISVKAFFDSKGWKLAVPKSVRKGKKSKAKEPEKHATEKKSSN